MNKIILTGRLTENPELKKVGNGISTLRFSVAVRRNYKNSNGEYPTDFLNCTAWRQTAEYITKYCKKGDMIAVEGQMWADSFTDKETGKNRTRFFVNVENAERLSYEKKEAGNGNGRRTQRNIDADPDSFVEYGEDDDLP